jgi:hypothetical protein
MSAPTGYDHRSFLILAVWTTRVVALKHDPEKRVAVFRRDKRENAFARRSCSIKELKRDDEIQPNHRALVQRGVSGMPQSFDLVLHHQLPALELDYLQIVCGQVQKSFVQFVFENLVLPFKFNEMRQNCHSKPPRLG